MHPTESQDLTSANSWCYGSLIAHSTRAPKDHKQWGKQPARRLRWLGEADCTKRDKSNYQAFLTLPRVLNVDSRPSCSAVVACQGRLPNG